jgi:hypothetical protein
MLSFLCAVSRAAASLEASVLRAARLSTYNTAQTPWRDNQESHFQLSAECEHSSAVLKTVRNAVQSVSNRRTVSVVYWSEFLATDPDFPRSSGSGTGPTQPPEYNWGVTWKKSSGSGLESREYGHRIYIYIYIYRERERERERVWRRAREPILPVTSYFTLSFTSRFNSVLLIKFSLFEHLHFFH